MPGDGCPACRKDRWADYYKNNQQKISNAANQWNKNNRERCNQNLQKWTRRNLKQKLKYNKNWYHKNLEKAREASRKKYKGRKRGKTASWSNLEKIKQIYRECFELTKTTGVRHQVDHIFPLKSNWMCGLHVENNLQILTINENSVKGNRLWPGQLDCQRGSVYDIFSKDLTDLLND